MMIIICMLLLASCEDSIVTKESKIEKRYRVVPIGMIAEDDASDEALRAVWVSQFDMHPIYRDGGRQRDKQDYARLVEAMLDNLIRDGFNTVLLQVRPNGDSMFVSDIYPTSKYVAGSYGGAVEYDAVGIYLDSAKKKGISVHAWINPYRLCYEEELIAYGRGILYEWYCEGIGKRIERAPDGLLYLDPSYDEVHSLIADGASEILAEYDFDGIHLDDYFYPTEFEFDDLYEFSQSGYSDLGEFRRSNTEKTVRALYETVHGYDGRVFGVAPAGNIYSLESGWYIDIYGWLSSDGYVDYIMPQLYYGFNNATCPFDTVLTDWCNAVKNDGIKLYIGLSAAKCALGSEGVADAFAGSSGKYEWRDSKDILARSCKAALNVSDGVCIFSYSSFYDPITGKSNPLTDEERTAFIEVKGS